MICEFIAYSRHSAFWDPQGPVHAFSPVHLSLSEDHDTGLGHKKPADRNRAEAPHARNLIHRKEFLASNFAGDGGGSSVHVSFPVWRPNRHNLILTVDAEPFQKPKTLSNHIFVARLGWITGPPCTIGVR